MYAIEKLPSELILHIFEAMTNLGDLKNLLNTSKRLRDLFQANFRSLLRYTIIPRIFAKNAPNVEIALQATYSTKNIRCYCSTNTQTDVAASDTVQALGGQTEWQIEKSHDIWNAASTRTWDSMEVLQALIDMASNVEAFARMAREGNDKAQRELRKKSFGGLLEELLWDMQAYNLRFTNMQSIKWRDHVSRSPHNTLQALRCVAGQWFEGLTADKRELLLHVARLAGKIEDHHRVYFLTPPRDGFVYRIAYGHRIDELTLSPNRRCHDPVARAVSDLDVRDPLRLGHDHHKKYKEHSKEAHSAPKPRPRLSPQHNQRYDGGGPNRIASVRANLAGHLDQMIPATQIAGDVELVTKIGQYFGEKVTKMEGKKVLKKHLRMVAIDNGYGEQPEDSDEILADMDQCMETVERKWMDRRSMERRYGIKPRGPALPPGLSFSGIWDESDVARL